jgi:hypothetical protein
LQRAGNASTFQALLEVFGHHGLPPSLYTDRGSHYFHTPAAGGPVDRTHPTQVGRALAHLGIEHIAAYAPQARGRSERRFQTLQDRLVKDLALAGIGTLEAAGACRSRPVRCVRTSSKLGSGCSAITTAGIRASTGRAVWPATAPPVCCRRIPNRPPDLPPLCSGHAPNRVATSGRPMCYLNHTS